MGVQLACLLAIVLSGPLIATGTLARTTHVVISGPYRWVRHPMYAGLFLIVVPPIIATPTWTRAAILVLLVADLMVKLEYEESLLVGRFDTYRQYRERSWRIVPYPY